MTKTTFATLDDHRQAMTEWYIVDASKYVLGRMAVRIAEVLMGKNKPLYTPHLSVGAGVIVINASRVRTTGKKREDRVYRHWSGYAGGLHERTLGEYLDTNPAELINLTVRRMLPKTRMGRSKCCAASRSTAVPSTTTSPRNRSNSTLTEGLKRDSRI